ncbi:MAG: transposase [Bacteroidia bacterium]|nr:transposase [Bacteroidia bacterium]
MWVSILRTKTTGVIGGALSFDKNIYDGNTLDEALNQYQKLIGKEPRKIILDLGYRGRSKINSTEIVTPDKFKRTKISQYLRRKHQKDKRRRSSIEPVIGHLKQDHRVGRNYLKGLKGDQINILLAAAAYNFKRFIRLKGWCIDFSNFLYIYWN